jgi:hypothetical protein
VGSGRGASPGGGGPDLGYGEERGSPMVMTVHLRWRWTLVSESSGGLGGRLGARGGAPRRRGSGGDVGGAGERPVEVGTGEVITAEEEARRRSASMRLHGSQRLATKAHTKKTAGGAPGTWCGGLPATASSAVIGCRVRGTERTQWCDGEEVECR